MPSYSEEKRPGGITSFRIAEIAPIWMLVFLGAVDAGLSCFVGYKFTGFSSSVAGTIIMAGVCYAYGRSGRSKAIADMAYYAALWIAYTALGVMFTYLMASLRLPLFDERLAAFDAAIGFEWLRWHRFLAQFRFANLVLGIAYYSAILQIAMSIIYFCHTGQRERNAELWWNALISLLFTAVLSAFYPAVGAFQHFNVDLTKAIYLPHLLAIRDQSMTVFSLLEMKGIIAFPSYHTVMAILLTYAYRGKGALFLLAAVLNILMLLSTPTFGGHYLADMLAGAVVAGLAVYAVRHGPRLFKLGKLRKADIPAISDPNHI
jgi:hypothetical protein